MSECKEAKGVGFVYCRTCEKLHLMVFEELGNGGEPCGEAFGIANIPIEHVGNFLAGLVAGYDAYLAGATIDGASCTKH